MCQRCLDVVERDLEALRLLSTAASKNTPPRDVSDWKCTLMFYMACIYVKAIGHQRNVELDRHSEVRRWLNTSQDLCKIALPYRKLEDHSQEARYEGRLFTRPNLLHMYTWFVEIRDAIVPLLRNEGLPASPSVDPKPYL